MSVRCYERSELAATWIAVPSHLRRAHHDELEGGGGKGARSLGRLALQGGEGRVFCYSPGARFEGEAKQLLAVLEDVRAST